MGFPARKEPAIFSFVALGLLFNAENTTGNVVRLATAQPVKIDSIGIKSDALYGQKTSVQVSLIKPEKSFSYGYVECDFLKVNGLSISASSIDTRDNKKCFQFPKSYSFTYEYTYTPAFVGYLKVKSCKVVSSANMDCSGSKLINQKLNLDNKVTQIRIR